MSCGQLDVRVSKCLTWLPKCCGLRSKLTADTNGSELPAANISNLEASAAGKLGGSFKACKNLRLSSNALRLIGWPLSD